MINVFISYLTSDSRENIHSLVNVLRSNNYFFESEALVEYYNQSEINCIISKNNPWTKGKSYVGHFPPDNAADGDIWLDAVELSPYILIMEMNSWVALHPVYAWQFKAFLNLVKFEFIQSMNSGFSDFLNPRSERLKFEKDTDFITNIFNEEARAYSVWMGKSLLGEDLASVKECVSEELLTKIAPEGLNLWDWPGHPGSENARIAYNRETIDYDFIDDLENLPKEKQAVFNVFETNKTVGLSTIFPLANGLIKSKIPSEVGDYVRLLNLVHRTVK